MKYYLIVIATLLMLPLQWLNAEAPIVVNLATEAKRIPLYLPHLITEGSGFDADYGNRLEQVFQFDFENNGMTVLLPVTKERDKLVDPQSFDWTPVAATWKGLGAYYVLKVQVKDKKLSARLFAANTETVRSVNDIPLTGDINTDRRKVHQVSDTIYKALFGTDGIASTRILYTVKNSQQDSKWASELWESDYDGANRRKLSFEGGGYVVTPVYLPPKPGFGSGTVFYVSYQTGQPKIYYQSLTDGSQPRRLTTLRGNQLMPAISRQRDKIAFICDVTGNPDLFIQPFNPDVGAVGKPYQIFSSKLATQGSPTFSPDGKQIAFVSNKDGAPRIYVMPVPAPGTSLKDIKATIVTKHNQESSAPAWSPDGTKLAYCSSVKGVRQVWLYDFATKEERQLTQGPGNKENPTWAPDSLHLVFNSTDPGASDLFLINLNQSNAVKITSGPGEKRFPSWEPRN